MAEQTRQRKSNAVGVQMFNWIRERQTVYVDKTEYVWKMMSSKQIAYESIKPKRHSAIRHLSGAKDVTWKFVSSLHPKQQKFLQEFSK